MNSRKCLCCQKITNIILVGREGGAGVRGTDIGKGYRYVPPFSSSSAIDSPFDSASTFFIKISNRKHFRSKPPFFQTNSRSKINPTFLKICFLAIKFGNNILFFNKGPFIISTGGGPVATSKTPQKKTYDRPPLQTLVTPLLYRLYKVMTSPPPEKNMPSFKYGIFLL